MAEEKYIFNDNGDFFKTSALGPILKIYLKLRHENTERILGFVNTKDRVLHIKRKKAKHLFKKNNSYGFNEYLINNGQTFDKILLSDEDGNYLFPKSLVSEKGSYLHFKQDGFERQLFLPVSFIKEHQIASV